MAARWWWEVSWVRPSGAQAFASAFIFTYLTEYQNWSGFEAFLVGEHLMKSGDPAAALRGLVGA